MNSRRLLLIGAGVSLLVAAICYSVNEINSLRARVNVQQEREAELVVKLQTEARSSAELRATLLTERLVRSRTPSIPTVPARRGDYPGRAYRDQIREREELMRRLHDPQKSGVDTIW
jgi:hypothetical protein